MSDTRITNEADAAASSVEEVLFDEAAFIRKARARSVRRTGAIALATVPLTLLILVGAWVGWQNTLNGHASRLQFFYEALIPLTHPNTQITAPGHRSVGFPGAQATFSTHRLVGIRPMLQGEVVVDFEIWGGAVANMGMAARELRIPRRSFIGTEMVPELSFLYPQNPADTDSDLAVDDLAARTAATRERLSAAPDSFTAEVALSFIEPMTLNRVEGLLPPGVTLNWGAVDVWERGQAETIPWPGKMVGISFLDRSGEPRFGSREDLERDLPDELRSLAELGAWPTTDLANRSAAFIERNGVTYYGVVVTGPVAEIRPLLDLDEVSAATLGFVVAPWE